MHQKRSANCGGCKTNPNVCPSDTRVWPVRVELLVVRLAVLSVDYRIGLYILNRVAGGGEGPVESPQEEAELVGDLAGLALAGEWVLRQGVILERAGPMPRSMCTIIALISQALSAAWIIETSRTGGGLRGIGDAVAERAVVSADVGAAGFFEDRLRLDVFMKTLMLQVEE